MTTNGVRQVLPVITEIVGRPIANDPSTLRRRSSIKIAILKRRLALRANFLTVSVLIYLLVAYPQAKLPYGSTTGKSINTICCG